MLRVPLVAGKELVAAVATEHDFHMSRRFPGQVPRGHARRIGKRLVKIGDDSLKSSVILRFIGMARFERPSVSAVRSRILAFVERGATERGGEGLQTLKAHRCETARDGAGIDAGRQEKT